MHFIYTERWEGKRRGRGRGRGRWRGRVRWRRGKLNIIKKMVHIDDVTIKVCSCEPFDFGWQRFGCGRMVLNVLQPHVSMLAHIYPSTVTA